MKTKTIEQLELLHKKALKLLALAEEAEKRIEVQKESIRKWMFHYFYTVEACDEKIKSLKAARQRILLRYDRILDEIFEYNR